MDSHMENKPRANKEEVGGDKRKFSIKYIHTAVHKRANNKDRLYGTGNYIQCLVISCNGKNPKNISIDTSESQYYTSI